MTQRSELLPQLQTEDPAPRRRGLRRVGVLVGFALAVLIAVGAVLGSRLGSDPTLVRSPLIGKPAPSLSLPNLEGTGRLDPNLPVGRITVVNFWASWCVACREEHPALLAAAAAYRDRGVRFVGVVYQDNPSNARRMLDELGRGDGYSYVTDPGSRSAIDWGVFGVPETFFVDQRGTVVAKVVGKSDYTLLSGTLDQILRGEQPSSRRTGQEQSAPQ